MKLAHQANDEAETILVDADGSRSHVLFLTGFLRELSAPLFFLQLLILISRLNHLLPEHFRPPMMTFLHKKGMTAQPPVVVPATDQQINPDERDMKRMGRVQQLQVQ